MFLILLFFYYFLNSSQEPLYMYDYSALNQEYLVSLPRIHLIEVALSCESFIRKKKGVKLLGGLHDYIDSLENKEIITIIKSFVSENPELDITKLEGFKFLKFFSNEVHSAPWRTVFDLTKTASDSGRRPPQAATSDGLTECSSKTKC